jgi:hypothetical protein
MPSQIAPSGPECLQGWKEIALYLGRGLRTVQRYEASFGLPVRRYAGRDAGSVVAFKSDLNCWLGSKPVRRRVQARRPNGGAPSVERLRISMEKTAQLHHNLRSLGMETLRATWRGWRNCGTRWSCCAGSWKDRLPRCRELRAHFGPRERLTIRRRQA